MVCTEERTSGTRARQGGTRSDAPFVSIIVICLNEAEHVARCLEAIESVDYPRDRREVIFVDGGSTDGSPEIAAEHGVQVVRARPSISEQRNVGVGKARGSFLAFTDADCAVSRTWLSSGLMHFKCPDDEVVVGSSPTPSDGNSWVRRACRVHQRAKLRVVGRLVSGMTACGLVCGGSIITTRRAFERVGGFSADVGVGEDADLCYRAAMTGMSVVFDQSMELQHYGGPGTFRQFFWRQVAHASADFTNWGAPVCSRADWLGLLSVGAVLTIGFLIVSGGERSGSVAVGVALGLLGILLSLSVGACVLGGEPGAVVPVFLLYGLWGPARVVGLLRRCARGLARCFGKSGDDIARGSDSKD
jgi:GT2 family glycosyltransferase